MAAAAANSSDDASLVQPDDPAVLAPTGTFRDVHVQVGDGTVVCVPGRLVAGSRLMQAAADDDDVSEAKPFPCAEDCTGPELQKAVDLLEPALELRAWAFTVRNSANVDDLPGREAAEKAKAAFEAEKDERVRRALHWLAPELVPNLEDRDTAEGAWFNGGNDVMDEARAGLTDDVNVAANAKVLSEGHIGLLKLWLHLGLLSDEVLNGGTEFQSSAEPSWAQWDFPKGGLLHAAVMGKRADAVRFLLAKGANPNNTRGYSATTPLHFAASGGDVDMCTVLLDAGADVNVCGGSWEGTPLHRAAAVGHAAVASLLLDRGADPMVETENDSMLPISVAASSGHEDVVRVLALRSSADSTDLLRFVLNFAAKRGSRSLCEAILDHGGDAVLAPDSWHGSSVQAAEKAGHTELAAWLRSKGVEE